MPLDVALARLSSADREVRRTTAEAVTEALQPGLRTRGFIFNTLALDKAVDDRLRSYPTGSPAATSPTRPATSPSRRWSRRSRTATTCPSAGTGSRRACSGSTAWPTTTGWRPSSGTRRAIGWPEATEVVLDAFGSFSPALADTAREFFDGRYIDVPVRPGKRGGAFCSYTVPSRHPYVLLNWTGKRRDALTLAHELGHGVHAALARPRGVFEQSRR